MKKIILILSLVLSASICANSIKIKANLWKKGPCNLDELCLPQAISAAQTVEIPEPEFQSFSQVTVEFKEHWASFILTKREGSGGYYSFQTELVEKATVETVAVCARYEAIDTFETSIVGSCGGRAKDSDALIGVTLSLP